MKWFINNDGKFYLKTYLIKYKNEYKEDVYFGGCKGEDNYKKMVLSLLDIKDKESKYIYENNKVKKIYYFDVYEYDFGYGNYANVRKLDMEKIYIL